jgi:hypothetical protein
VKSLGGWCLLRCPALRRQSQKPSAFDKVEAKRSKNPGLTLSFFSLSIKDFGVFLFLAASFFLFKKKKNQGTRLLKRTLSGLRPSLCGGENPGKV